MVDFGVLHNDLSEKTSDGNYKVFNCRNFGRKLNSTKRRAYAWKFGEVCWTHWARVLWGELISDNLILHVIISFLRRLKNKPHVI